MRRFSPVLFALSACGTDVAIFEAKPGLATSVCTPSDVLLWTSSGISCEAASFDPNALAGPIPCRSLIDSNGDGRIDGAIEHGPIFDALGGLVNYEAREDGQVSRAFVDVPDSGLLGIDYTYGPDGKIESAQAITHTSLTTNQYIWEGERLVGEKIERFSPTGSHLSRPAYLRYKYDRAGRLTEQIYGDSRLSEEVRWWKASYDDRSRLSQVTISDSRRIQSEEDESTFNYAYRENRITITPLNEPARNRRPNILRFGFEGARLRWSESEPLERDSAATLRTTYTYCD